MLGEKAQLCSSLMLEGVLYLNTGQYPLGTKETLGYVLRLRHDR